MKFFHILLKVWRLWNGEKCHDFMDPILQNSAPTSEVMKCIQIGMLCVQGNTDDRPTMATVVLMLNGSMPLPSPSTPLMAIHDYSLPRSTDQYTSKSETE